MTTAVEALTNGVAQTAVTFFCGQRMLRAMRARRTAVRFGDVTAGTDAYLPMIYFTSCLFFCGSFVAVHDKPVRHFVGDVKSRKSMFSYEGSGEGDNCVPFINYRCLLSLISSSNFFGSGQKIQIIC